MKYDRPVWQLMHACADAMPDTFGYADVRAWFDEHYPEVGEATLRAHIVGLTEGGAAKHPQFQRRSPLFRRVERGVYAPIPLAERGEDPDAADDDEDVTAPTDGIDRTQIDRAASLGDVSYGDELDEISGDADPVPPTRRSDEFWAAMDDRLPPAPAPAPESAGFEGVPKDEDVPSDTAGAGAAPSEDGADAGDGTRGRGLGRLRRGRRDARSDTDDQVARRLGRPDVAREAQPTAPDFDLDDDAVAAMYTGSIGNEVPTAADFVEPAAPTPADEPAPSTPRAMPSIEQSDAMAARYQAEVEAERARLRAERAEAEAQRQALLEQERRRSTDPEPARPAAEASDAIAAERAELASRLAEAEQFKVSHEEISRRAADEIDAQRRQLVAEREEMARVAAERAHARQAAADELEAERARLEEQAEELRRIAAEGAEARRVALKAMESERLRLEAERERAAREAAERARLEAARLESERAAAENAAIEQTRAESLRLTQAREEAERHAAAQVEAARIASELAEEQRRIAAEAEAERLELLRLETTRAEAVRAQAERLRAERIEAEQAVADEKRRARKLRKNAERARELAAQLEAERGERVAREHAQQLALDEAAQRRRQEQERVIAAENVRDDMTRLEREALARLESDRARAAFARTEQAAPTAAPAPVHPVLSEDEQLAREEQEHQQSLRSARRQVPLQSPTPPGGAYIVRAPRPDQRPPIEPPARPEPPQAARPSVVPSPQDDQTPSPDAILLGSAGGRVAVPAPAKDSYRDLQFQLGRFDAELSGARWFVLSAELGLLEPDEWVSPDDDQDEGDDPTRRSAWASWVVARLESLIGPLDGKHVHVDAPEDYAGPLGEVLTTEGARVTHGVLPTGWARREAAAAPAPRAATPPVPEVDSAAVEPVPEVAAASVVDDRPDARVIPFSRAASVSQHLADADLAIPASAARGLPHQSGLYAWLIDAQGAHTLSGALGLPVRPGPLYVGQVGAPNGISDSSTSLNDHVNLVELYGSARSSAFRTDLATALAESLGLTSIEDARLTDWMVAHLSIAVWPTEDVAHLQQVKHAVIVDLLPPFSFDHPQGAVYRERIAELRSRLA